MPVGGRGIIVGWEDSRWVGGVGDSTATTTFLSSCGWEGPFRIVGAIAFSIVGGVGGKLEFPGPYFLFFWRIAGLSGFRWSKDGSSWSIVGS